MIPTMYNQAREQAEEIIRKQNASDTSDVPATEQPVTEHPTTETHATEAPTEASTETPDTKAQVSEPTEAESSEPVLQPTIGEHESDLQSFQESMTEIPPVTFVPPETATESDMASEPEITETPEPEEPDADEDTNESEDNRPTPGVSAYSDQRKSAKFVPARQESERYPRGVPATIAEIAKNMFPSYGFEKAITAYIYLKEGCPKGIDVPGDIKAAALERQKNGGTLSNMDMQANLINKISSLENQMKQMQKDIRKLTFLAAYNQYSRDGFAENTPRTLADVRFGVPVEYMDKIEVGFQNTDQVLQNQRKKIIR